ncbi:MAG: hypothetical protein II064_05135, partial [Bacteroidales bacterium]|nr:hypothetical protein [Bacteroidales bacterium]
IKVALEIQRNLGEFTVVKLNNGANICQFHISIFLDTNIQNTFGKAKLLRKNTSGKVKRVWKSTFSNEFSL